MKSKDSRVEGVGLSRSEKGKIRKAEGILLPNCLD